MKILKSKWKNAAESPVIFMIDDLANKYINLNNSETNIIGCDWGAKTTKENSFYSILKKEFLDRFSYLKVTMFLVVGRREPIIEKGHNFYSESIDDNDEIRNFIKMLSNDERVELAYHGYTHGKCHGNDIYAFKEEWETFESIDEAIKQIEEGKNLYESVTGNKFLGGKYCGYKYCDFSDESIVKSGFLWWCRHWDGNLFFDKNDKFSFELEEFSGVVDIPSSIDGSFYSIKNYKKMFTKKYFKSLLLILKNRMTIESQIKYLIDNNLVVSIQEHTAPYRVDNRIQYPNIISDKENLIYIFNYLKNFNLWYATCSEVANYYKAYKYTKLELNKDKLVIKCPKELNGKELTILLDDIDNKLNLVHNGEKLKKIKCGENRYYVNLKLENEKIYHLI